MTIVETDVYVPPCAREPQAFHVEDSHDVSALHRQCAGCPMLVDCLYRAVVEVDVSGFAACTTETDRARIRDELGIVLQPAQPLVLGAPRVGTGPVDHETVLQMRHAHPKDTCQQLAERLGCSTSTVKRHLRRARQGTAPVPAKRVVDRPAPSVDEVLDCFDRLESSRLA